MKIRITLVIFLLTLNFAVFAQDTEQDNELPQVLVQTFPEIPVTGRSWTLTLIVDYPNPDEITVIAPEFGVNGALALERTVKTARTIDTRAQTAVEYRFAANRSGRFTLDSFTVISPAGISSTRPLTLNIRSETEEIKPVVLKLVWEGASAQMEQGKPVTLLLRSSSQNLQQTPQAFFMPDVPSGAILSPLPLSAQDRESGITAKFNFIPLSGSFNLPARTLQFENTIYEIPALQIRITDRAAGQSADADPSPSAESALANDGVNAAKPAEDNLLIAGTSGSSKLQRILRLAFFYSGLFIVIIIMFVCLYLLIKRKSTT